VNVIIATRLSQLGVRVKALLDSAAKRLRLGFKLELKPPFLRPAGSCKENHDKSKHHHEEPCNRQLPSQGRFLSTDSPNYEHRGNEHHADDVPDPPGKPVERIVRG